MEGAEGWGNILVYTAFLGVMTGDHFSNGSNPAARIDVLGYRYLAFCNPSLLISLF